MALAGRCKIIATIFAFLSSIILAHGQADTVFIKYNKLGTEAKLSYTTDTLVFGSPYLRHVIYGTTVLPWTENQQVAKGFGIDLRNVTSSDCIESEEHGGDQVVAITETDTSLKIEIKIWGNCCHDFLCDLEIVEDSIINLVHYGYGATFCFCDCCYGLVYEFDKWKFDEYELLKGVMINTDRRTMMKLK